MATNIPQNLKYTTEHDWVLIEGETATIGLTDFAQKSLGDIVFLELPEIGTTLSKGDTFGVVESIKSVTDLHAPVSGEVLERNESATDKPESLNSDPYAAWMLKIKLSNKEEINSLLSPEKYEEHCSSAH